MDGEEGELLVRMGEVSNPCPQFRDHNVSRVVLPFVCIFLVKQTKGLEKERLLELKGLMSTITGMSDSTIKVLSCGI